MSTPASRAPGLGTVGRWAILGLSALYFVGPMLAALIFTVRDRAGHWDLDAYSAIFAKPATGQTGFVEALLFSLVLSAATIVVTMVLMVPTQLLLHLKLPKLKGLVEILCLLPLVCPPIVLVVGVSSVYRSAQPAGAEQGSIVFEALRWIRDGGHPLLLVFLYVILALPFVYRMIDAGIGSVPVTTLVEASRSIGASWVTTVVRVLLPTLKTSIVNAAFLCFALTMGEYTVSSVLLYTEPFPVWLAQLPTSSGQTQAAVSLFGLVLVEVILLIISGVGVRSGSSRGKASS